MSITIEDYTEEILDCIGALYKHLELKNDWNHQSRYDIDHGNFRRKKENILVPLSDIKHRMQFECHEQLMLDGYLKLAKSVKNKPEDPLSLFVLRVLCEMGFDKIDVLFPNEISLEEKLEFKLIDSLSDLLGVTGGGYELDFLALLDDERGALDPEMRKLCEKAELILKRKGKIELSLLKKVRRHVSSRLAYLGSKIVPPNLLKGKTDLEHLNITLSHLLHGNPIIIKVAIDSKFSRARANWVFATVWNTGLNILLRTKSIITDVSLQKRIEVLLQDAEPVWVELQKRRLKY